MGMCSSVLNGNSAQENTVPQTDRAGPKREVCSSRCPHAVSFPAFTAVQDITESAYFSLLFLVQSSWNTITVLMVSVFHSASLQSCRDAPWLWPCVNSTTASCASSNLRNCNTVFNTSSSSQFCRHLRLSWVYGCTTRPSDHKPSSPCKAVQPAGEFSSCPSAEKLL